MDHKLAGIILEKELRNNLKKSMALLWELVFISRYTLSCNATQSLPIAPHEIVIVGTPNIFI